jgi:hypothetical protein
VHADEILSGTVVAMIFFIYTKLFLKNIFVEIDINDNVTIEKVNVTSELKMDKSSIEIIGPILSNDRLSKMKSYSSSKVAL